ncbi:MAG: hypothetical protein FD124_3862, partial [Alphaproteobacteria bacterium]
PEPMVLELVRLFTMYVLTAFEVAALSVTYRWLAPSTPSDAVGAAPTT